MPQVWPLPAAAEEWASTSFLVAGSGSIQLRRFGPTVILRGSFTPSSSLGAVAFFAQIPARLVQQDLANPHFQYRLVGSTDLRHGTAFSSDGRLRTNEGAPGTAQMVFWGAWTLP